MKKVFLLIALMMVLSTGAKAQFHVAGYGGLTFPSVSKTSYSLEGGTTFGGQLLYEFPSVEGLSVGAEVDFFSARGMLVSSYRFLPVTVGVNYVWQFSEPCGLSAHIGVGFNYRSLDVELGDNDNGTTFAYRVGLDLLLARHFSIGFRWHGLGNVPCYESLPVELYENGDASPNVQRRSETDKYSLGVFTLIAGIRF